MTGSVTQGAERAGSLCAAMPEATLEHPFGPQTDVYKVGGKMFAAVRTSESPPVLTVKCEPSEAAALVAEREDVEPARWMDKRSWVSVELRSGVGVRFLEELVSGSYRLVVENLPRKDQPGEARPSS